MIILDKHEDYKDLECSYSVIQDCIVYETHKEWKDHINQERAEFLERMDSGRMMVVMGGMEGFHSPIDGKYIGNRDDLSAHNRAHDVYQVGNEYTKDDGKKMMLKREEYLDTHSEKDIV